MSMIASVSSGRRLALGVRDVLRAVRLQPVGIGTFLLGSIWLGGQIGVSGLNGAPPAPAIFLEPFVLPLLGCLLIVAGLLPAVKAAGGTILRRGSVTGLTLALAVALSACGSGTGTGVGAEFYDPADADAAPVDQGMDSVAAEGAESPPPVGESEASDVQDAGLGQEPMPRDECLYGEDECQAGERCVDLPVGYRCDPPPGESVPIAPADPCSDDHGGCDANASCSVVEESAVCDCLPGFEGDGVTCEWVVRALDVDEFHACAVTQDGSLWCWGRNEQGVLGVGEVEAGEVLSPTQVGDQRGWEQVVVSQSRSIAIRNGELYAFGDNGLGRLGLDVETSAVWEPERVGDADDWHGLSAGLGHTCGLRGPRSAGSLHCWGDFGEQDSVRMPTAVDGRHWRIVRTSGVHMCGIDSEGALFCWGQGNGEGALGLGEEAMWDAIEEPTQVGEQRDWTHLSVGTHTSCGIRRGQLWCWGLVTADPNAAFANYPEPTRIGVEDDWTAITVPRGTDSAGCGVRSGQLWCWGANALGQAGDPSTGTPRERAALRRLGAGDNWVSAASGREVTCAVRQSGEVQCWGSNEHGRLGGVGAYPPEVVEPTQVGADADWGTVSAGWEATCGLRAGQMACWGRRAVLGVLAPEPAPVDGTARWSSVQAGFWGMAVGVAVGESFAWGDAGRLSTPTADAAEGVAEAVLSRGRGELSWSRHNRCVLRQDGELSCRGSNAAGQLGLGDRELRTEWAQVSGRWQHATMGHAHACGISDAGQLYCWGSPQAVGLEAEGHVLVPTLVDAHEDWSAVSANAFNTCGLRAGQLWCWRHSAPIRMGGRDDWQTVSASPSGGCGIAGGALYCWGSNRRGELGIPGVVSTTQPALVDDGARWVAVSAGRRHACAVRGDRTLWCWGDNAVGETGTGSSWSHVPRTVIGKEALRTAAARIPA